MRRPSTTSWVYLVVVAAAFATCVSSAAFAQGRTLDTSLRWWPQVFAAAQTDVATKVAATATKPSVTDVVKAMQAYYNTTDAYFSKFEQVQEEINGLTRSSWGEVWFKKPGKMRWDYEPGTESERYLMSDGATFWAWEPQYRQYCAQSLADSQLPTALTFLAGQGQIAMEFDVELLESNGKIHRLGLTPKVPTSAYATVEFTVDATTHRVDQAVIVDALGNINTLKFSEPDLNPVVDDANFAFTPPADATHLCAQKNP